MAAGAFKNFIAPYLISKYKLQLLSLDERERREGRFRNGSSPRDICLCLSCLINVFCF